jgi:hypothetical protein
MRAVQSIKIFTRGTERSAVRMNQCPNLEFVWKGFGKI